MSDLMRQFRQPWFSVVVSGASVGEISGDSHNHSLMVAALMIAARERRSLTLKSCRAIVPRSGS